MPSLPDTAVIIILGLLLFGPKGLAQIARQLGKLMGEFRRASNEFRMQMEEELRISEQADRQKEIAAMQAAAPIAAPLVEVPQAAIASSAPAVADPFGESHPQIPSTLVESAPEEVSPSSTPTEPLPIATSGDLQLMPPATGLPEARSGSLSSLIDSVPKGDPSIPMNGTAETSYPGEGQRPMRYTNHHTENGVSHTVVSEESIEESIHG